MTKINGEQTEVHSITIAAYLAQAGYDPDRVVVEQNLNILPREQWETALIQDGDSLEILCFVGGG